ncbi:DNA repair protein RadC [Devosia sp. FKR38]|uniref:RadC family protein n=1 Tax=Devosia sp. FKR38 TaxID=2562312 RepID=UPI0010C14995|nr:DNA repair protein RadC [Devosia sp. FKR38]
MADRPDAFDEAGFLPAPAAADDHAGHRKRVRDRFLKVGGDALEDYELLELALQLIIPRKDTKALAKTLLREFGSFSGVFNASQARLSQVKGLGETTIAHLKVIQAVAARFGRDRIDSQQPILSSWSQLIDYCNSQMAYQSIEQFRILFLDKKNRLIADEVQQTGTVDHTPVYPREVIRRTLELSATALILVHNHPSGDPAPSSADVRMTKEIADVAKPLGITLHDHIIIGKSGHTSLRALKLI